jgi:hypothetical protein
LPGLLSTFEAAAEFVSILMVCLHGKFYNIIPNGSASVLATNCEINKYKTGAQLLFYILQEYFLDKHAHFTKYITVRYCTDLTIQTKQLRSQLSDNQTILCDDHVGVTDCREPEQIFDLMDPDIIDFGTSP